MSRGDVLLSRARDMRIGADALDHEAEAHQEPEWHYAAGVARKAALVIAREGEDQKRQEREAGRDHAREAPG